MPEERQEELVLERWACGCRRWIIEQIDEARCLEDEWVERQELCHELEDLYKREGAAELEEHTALLEHGAGSPTHTRVFNRRVGLLGKIEEHYNHHALEAIEPVGREEG